MGDSVNRPRSYTSGPPGAAILAAMRARTTNVEGNVRLAGRTALITGASHGIGRATALAFAREGADIAITYRRRDEGVRETASEIVGLGRRVHVMQAELSERERCAAVVDEATQV